MPKKTSIKEQKSTTYETCENLASFSFSITVRKILKGVCETASKCCYFANCGLCKEWQRNEQRNIMHTYTAVVFVAVVFEAYI